MLADVVAELEEKGLARESDGALCVFPPGFTGRDGEPLPLIVRKQDGGYGYAHHRPRGRALPRRRRSARAGSSTSSARRRRSTSRWSSRWRSWPAGWCPRRAPSTSRSARCSAPTRRCSRPAAARRCSLARSARRGGRSARRDVIAEKNPELDAADARSSRARRGHRRREVRRPLQRPHQGLRLRLEPHARLRGQHRAVPAVCARAHPLDLPPRRGRRAAAGRHRRRRPRRAGARARAPRLRLGRPRGGGHARSRTGSARTCSSSPRRSRRSTSSARCSRRPPTRSGGPGSPSAI